MKRITLLIIVSLIVLSSFNISASSLSEECGAQIISYALFDGEEKIASSGKENCFAIGSVSKVFTAALTLKLCEEDVLSLDGKVWEYLPEFSMNDIRYKDITVKHLLNHTSGLMGSTMKNTMLYKKSDSWNHDNFLSLLKNQNLKYAPGQMANYCNDGYTLLELIIEKVSGMEYTDYLYKVFSALPQDRFKTAENVDLSVEEIVNSIAAGGIYSDAETVCKAIYKLICTDTILSDNSRKLMQSHGNDAKKDGEFGLGWDSVTAYPFDKYGIKALTKGGDTLYYHSSVVVLPEYDITACVILKEGDSRVAEAEAKKLIIDYLKEKNGTLIEYYGYEKPAVENTDDLDSLSGYEGLYLSGSGQFKFSVKSGFGILSELFTGKNTPLTYMGNGVFDAGDGILYFSEEDGNIYMMIEGISALKGGAFYRYFEYYGVKVQDGGDANSSWHERNGKVYFICDERYDSLLYMEGITALTVAFSSEMPGYLSYLKTVDDNTALSDIALPGAYGRDLTDITVFNENGKEYLKSQEWTFLDREYIGKIYNGEKSVCTILPDGYTRWFASGDAAGKTLKAEIAGNGMFAIYDENGRFLYSSLKDGPCATIPENGYIAFSGEVGTVFEITLA